MQTAIGALSFERGTGVECISRDKNGVIVVVVVVVDPILLQQMLLQCHGIAIVQERAPQIAIGCCVDEGWYGFVPAVCDSLSVLPELLLLMLLCRCGG